MINTPAPLKSFKTVVVKLLQRTALTPYTSLKNSILTLLILFQSQVSQIRKERKTQQKENPNHSEQQQPSAPEVKHEKRDSLSFLSAKPAPVTPPKPQRKTSSQLLPPTVYLNIFLRTPSDLLPVLQQTGQNSIVNLASLRGNTEWSSVAEVGVSPAYQTDPGKSTQMSQECRQ